MLGSANAKSATDGVAEKSEHEIPYRKSSGEEIREEIWDDLPF